MRTTDYLPRGATVTITLNAPQLTTLEAVTLLSVDSYGLTVREDGAVVFVPFAGIRTVDVSK
jgi:hypothetical protein